MSRFSLLLMCAGINITAHAQEAPFWDLTAESRLDFRAVQQGAEFTGSFEQFRAEIQFSPGQLTQSEITVTVVMASVNTAYDDRDEALRSEIFFDVAQWPEAVFRVSEFHDLGGDDFDAVGDLTIRDRTHRIQLPFRFSGDGENAHLTGETVISRLEYGIGLGEWADSPWVGPDVTIQFDLTLTVSTTPGALP